MTAGVGHPRGAWVFPCCWSTGPEGSAAGVGLVVNMRQRSLPRPHQDLLRALIPDASCCLFTWPLLSLRRDHENQTEFYILTETRLKNVTLFMSLQSRNTWGEKIRKKSRIVLLPQKPTTANTLVYFLPVSSVCMCVCVCVCRIYNCHMLCV